MIVGYVSLLESGQPLAAPLRALTIERPGASSSASDWPSEGEDMVDCIDEDQIALPMSGNAVMMVVRGASRCQPT